MAACIRLEASFGQGHLLRSRPAGVWGALLQVELTGHARFCHRRDHDVLTFSRMAYVYHQYDFA